MSSTPGAPSDFNSRHFGIGRFVRSIVESFSRPRPSRRRRRNVPAVQALEERVLLTIDITQVEDAIPGGGISNRNFGTTVESFTDVNGTAYFTQQLAPFYSESCLWKLSTNGLAVKVPLAKSALVSGESDSFQFRGSPTLLTNVNGTLYFSAAPSSGGLRLWRVNSAGEAEIVSDRAQKGGRAANPSFYEPTLFHVYRDTLYFAARIDQQTGLWRINQQGMAERVRLVSSVGTSSRNAEVNDQRGIIATDDDLYFAVKPKDIASTGVELWWIGESGEPQPVRYRVDNGVPGPTVDHVSTFHINTSGDNLCFRKTVSLNAEFFRVSNGISTVHSGLMKPNVSFDYEHTLAGTDVFFIASTESDGVELFRIDEAGRVSVVDDDVSGEGIGPGSLSSSPDKLTVLNGVLYFTANNGVDGIELWRFDSSTGRAEMVSDKVAGTGLNPGAVSATPESLVMSGGTLWFTADNGRDGRELWRIDPAGMAVMVEDKLPGGGINPSAASSEIKDMVDAAGTLFFVADDGVHGPEIWRASSTGIAGIVDDGRGETGISSTGSPVALRAPSGLVSDIPGDSFYFRANDGESGEEIWRVRGDQNAVLIGNALGVGGIRPGVEGSWPSFIGVSGGVVYVIADDGSSGLELHRIIDNDRAELVEDQIHGSGITNHSFSSNPEYFTNVNGTVYFTADDSENGRELWKLNEAEIAELVEDAEPGGGLNSGFASANPEYLTEVSGELYFIAYTPNSGRELWTINSAGQAELVEDQFPGGGIGPGNKDGQIDDLMNVNGVLYFTASDGVNGKELWRVATNGRAEMVEDSVPGGGIGADDNSAAIDRMANINGTLYFSGNLGRGPLFWMRINSFGFAEVIRDEKGNAATLLRDLDGDMDHQLVEAAGTIYFPAMHTDFSRQLMRLLPDGTYEVVMIASQNGASPTLTPDFSPDHLTVAGNTLYFRAKTNDGVELWRVNDDGFAEMVEDAVPGGGISPGLESSWPESPFAVVSHYTDTHLGFVDGHVFFKATSPEYGSHIWRINDDGIAEMVKGVLPDGNTAPDHALAGPYYCYETKTHFIFEAGTWAFGYNLWSVDSTGMASVILQEDRSQGNLTGLKPVTGRMEPFELGGKLYFQDPYGIKDPLVMGADGVLRIADDLIFYDESGVVAHSVRVMSPTTEANGQLYFSMMDGQSGEIELWVRSEEDESQSFTLNNDDLPENLSAGAVVGEFVDVTGNTSGPLVYSLAAGFRSEGNRYFEIEDNRLITKARFDAEVRSQYSLRIKATDKDGVETIRHVVVHIREVNERPAQIRLADNRITENFPAGSEVGSFSTIDPDVGEMFVYAFAPGDGDADNGSFRIDGSRLLTTAPLNFEEKPEHQIRVRVTDSAGHSMEKRMTVKVLAQLRGTAAADTFELRYTSTGFSITVSSIGMPPEDQGRFSRFATVNLRDLSNNDTLRIIGTSGKDVVSWNGTELKVNTARIKLSGLPRITITGGAGADTYRFDCDAPLGTVQLDELVNDGLDTIDFSTTDSRGVSLNLDSALAQRTNSNLRVKLSSNTSFERLVGGAGNDRLTGNAADNTLVGNAGNDRLEGAAGGDSLVGGTGDDTYVFPEVPLESDSSDRLRELLNEGSDTLDFSQVQSPGVDVNLQLTVVQSMYPLTHVFAVSFYRAQLNSGKTFENIIGSSTDDTLTGNSANNRILGGEGRDTIKGHSGNDRLLGGAADDTYIFESCSSPEEDYLNELPSDGIDTISFESLLENMSLSLGITSIQAAQRNRSIRLGTSVGFENLTGGAGNDSLIGNAADNILIGGLGNDRLDGRGGSDVTDGEAGDDRYVFYDTATQESDLILEYPWIGNHDALDFSAVTTSVSADLSTSVNFNDAVFGPVDIEYSYEYLRVAAFLNCNILIAGYESIEDVIGGQADDDLRGSTFDNLLVGNHGNDQLRGGDGNNRLSGGPGDDRYHLSAVDSNGTSLQSMVELSGGGLDTLDFSETSIGVRVDLSSTGVQASGSGSLRLVFPSQIENVFGSPFDDWIKGNGQSNVLIGNGGSDTILGMGGRDLLVGTWSAGEVPGVWAWSTGSLNGGDDDDVLIYGRMDRAFYEEDLHEFWNQWNSTASYSDRVSSLQTGTSRMATRLRASAVNNENMNASTIGGLGLDWFLDSVSHILDLSENEFPN